MLPTGGKYYTCPMCKGKGTYYVDQTELKYEVTKTRIKSGYCEQIKSASTGQVHLASRLPPINSQASPSPIGRKIEACIFVRLNFKDFLYSKTGPKEDSFRGVVGDGSSFLEQDLIGPADKLENPEETLKFALSKLKENQWDSSTQALLNIAQISRIQPEVLSSNMTIINRSLCSLLKSIRSHAVRMACQVAEELFKTMQSTSRPEFDELAVTLLQKSAHVNKGIRQDANKALDAMVTYIPLTHCVRVLSFACETESKNPLVRATVSRLVYNIISMVGVDTLMGKSNLKNTRGKIISICAKFLIDGNHETRNNAKMSVKLLMKHEDFEMYINQSVDQKVMEKIEKELVALKYA
ncbi:uncharacterized protein LOC105702854 [Orussus abietinus]|uniref:uncharacterized protein LOC105702854 n=1 Tax=Orussus abietinus TaxID=222816 RepID=UPI000C716153|nr:uncharacterized protein LOC105702854 [Orussus abietinus]